MRERERKRLKKQTNKRKIDIYIYFARAHILTKFIMIDVFPSSTNEVWCVLSFHVQWIGVNLIWHDRRAQLTP